MPRIILNLLTALVLTLGLAAAIPAAAQNDRDRAIRGTIQGQIDAFGQDDVTTAFGFASPSIRSMFGSAERFGQMVQQGYPMVWRQMGIEFLDLRDRGGRLVQMVLIRDLSGAYHTLAYEMVPDGDGGWRINGVQVLRDGAAAA